jgi:hypothetical protein
MPTISEETLAGWTGRASDAEQDRYERTRNAVIGAIKGSNAWQDANLETYAKGSYPNFTNVVRDSDVDIAVEMTSVFFSEFIHGAKDLTKPQVGISPYSGAYDSANLKDDIEAALVAEFGRPAITRGNKALHLRESSRSLAADVVPCFTYRAYYSESGSYRTGIQIHPDHGARIHNYPKQHLDEGVTKNNQTSRRYKRVVRILKRLENKMVDEGVIAAVPSFLIESMVWNVSNGAFDRATWTDRLRSVLVGIYEQLDDDEKASKMLEANNCKYLFHPTRTWTKPQAEQFILSAWRYMGY